MQVNDDGDDRLGISLCVERVRGWGVGYLRGTGLVGSSVIGRIAAAAIGGRDGNRLVALPQAGEVLRVLFYLESHISRCRAR